jgi:hypothetical protein
MAKRPKRRSVRVMAVGLEKECLPSAQFQRLVVLNANRKAGLEREKEERRIFSQS